MSKLATPNGSALQEGLLRRSAILYTQLSKNVSSTFQPQLLYLSLTDERNTLIEPSSSYN